MKCAVGKPSVVSVKRTDRSSLFSPVRQPGKTLLGGGCGDEYLCNSWVPGVLLEAAEMDTFQTRSSQEDALSHVLICLGEHSLPLLLKVT